MAKKSLLEKYEIDIGKLDFNYLEKCENGKEVERIFKILDSNEEGYYPELTEFAKQRLATLKPGSKCLRTEEKFIRKNDLRDEEKEELDLNLKKWFNNLKNKEEYLKSELIETNYNKHPIRKSEFEEENSENNQIKTHSDDNEEESEIDLNTLKISNRPQNEPENVLNKLSDVEKEEMSLYHKNKGNDYFKRKDYEDALEEYSKSISLYQNAAAFNNRAITNLKLKRNHEAIEDCDSCLKLEPHNTKALLRKAEALLEIEEKLKALRVYEQIKNGVGEDNEFVSRQMEKLKIELKMNEKAEKCKSENIDERELAELIRPKKILPNKTKQLVEAFKGKEPLKKKSPKSQEIKIKTPLISEL